MGLPNLVHIDLPSDNVRAIFLKIIQSEYGDEQAYAGRDCRTRLGRPNSQARAGQGNIHFPCSADHEPDWQPYPVDPYSCYCTSDMHRKKNTRNISLTNRKIFRDISQQFTITVVSHAFFVSSVLPLHFYC